MSRYVVRFMKDVLGENGRQREVCQSSLEIDASNEGHAKEVAKQKFCEQQSLCDWSLHADRIRNRRFSVLTLPVKNDEPEDGAPRYYAACGRRRKVSGEKHAWCIREPFAQP